MNEKFEKLICEIIILADKVTRTTKHDVFVEYYGHVKGFNVSYIKGGYKRYENEGRESIINIYTDEEDFKNKINLDSCKIALNHLLTGGDNIEEVI